MISEREAYEQYVKSCHADPMTYVSEYLFEEWRAMGRPISLRPSDGSWPTGPWEVEDDILAYLKMPLQVRTIDGVDVQYHSSQPIDYLLEEAAKEIERCRSMLSECADFIEFVRR